MRSWKTTVAALILNAAYAALTAYQTGGISARDILLMVAIQSVATLAKDFNVTGK